MRSSKMERYLSKVGDKNKYAQTLHSYAQDLSYAASSSKHDKMFRKSCKEIVNVIEEIPATERTNRTLLTKIVKQMHLTLSGKSFESSEDLRRKRPKLANDFIEILDKLYPINIEFSRYPSVKHQSF